MSVIGTVVSARTASTRLPGKALLPLAGIPMVQFLLERIRTTTLGGKVIFATTQRGDDDDLAAKVAELGIAVFRGADTDVAGRYLAAARRHGLDWVVRVTGDCPFVDAASLDHCLAQWNGNEDCDLLSTKGVFPVGIDYEVFPTALLEREWPKMTADEREHLTLRFYREELRFVVRRFKRPGSWRDAGQTYTVDTIEDYRKASRWVESLGSIHFPVEDLLALANGEPVTVRRAGDRG
jgi:spore coat polysaccharide biosynthesis protein SpsF (cytidylyltransferase family)